MFNFTFQYPYGFLCSFIPALFNIALLIYILFFLPRNRLTNIFALFTLNITLWQITDSLQRITITAETADFWDSIFSVSWMFIGALCLHFSILYTQIIKTAYHRLYVPLLYGPGFIFLSLYLIHFYPHIMQHTTFWGWVNFHNINPVDIVQIYWISALVLIALAILLLHTYKIKNDILLKKQSLLITMGIGIPAVTGVLTQVIFPTVFNISAIPVTSTFMTFFSIAAAVALRKYKLFTISDLINSEALIDSMPLIVFSISTEKRITYMNNFAMSMLGVSKQDISTKDVMKLFWHESDEDEKKLSEICERTIINGENMNAELAFKTSKGKMDVILSCNPVINNHKVQGVLITARDITELKKSYELIKYKEATLEEAQKLSHIGSWEWDIPSNVVTWSDELYRIFGYKPGEISMNYETYIENVYPADRNFVNGLVQNAYQEKKPFDFYHRIIKNDETEATLYSRGDVTVDKNNIVIKMTGTAQDVTEIKMKEAMLKQQNEELQKINAELDKFVYSVSHDLRAPLTSMLGIVAISQDETNDPVMNERLNLLKSNIKKLDQFILDILDYSRNARLEIIKEQINFEELLADITQNLKYISISNHMVDIRMRVKSNGVFNSDKTRIRIVLNNLISNAIRYSNPKTEKPFVEICIETGSKGAKISVRDNGIGIDKNYHTKIFEMFFRFSKDSVGSGLGLYLAKESLEKLNGTISVESQKGMGAVFSVYIPNN